MQSHPSPQPSSPPRGPVIDVAQALEFRHAMRDIQAALHAALDARLADRGVTAAQCAALHAFRANPGVNLSTVAARLHADAAALSRLLGRLEDKGLCLRFRPRGDRRAVRVEVLAPGIALADAFPALQAAVLEQVLDGLCGDERATLARAFARMLALGERLS